ncbi:hypothetical protein BH10ACT5_BH10ACT5_20050 [soil metagenome]
MTRRAKRLCEPGPLQARDAGRSGAGRRWRARARREDRRASEVCAAARRDRFMRTLVLPRRAPEKVLDDALRESRVQRLPTMRGDDRDGIPVQHGQPLQRIPSIPAEVLLGDARAVPFDADIAQAGRLPTMSGSKKSCLPPFRYFTSQSAIRRRSFDVNASPSPHTARACASSRRSTRSPSEPDESSARNTAARNEAFERLGRWRRASSPGSRPDGCRARAPCRPGAEPGRHVTAPARVEGPIPRRVCAARATRERPCRPWSVPTRRDPATAAT